MKTLLSDLSDIAVFIFFPLLFIMLKRKKAVSVYLSFIVITLSGCYLNFYRTNTTKAIDKAAIQELQFRNKYFIVHFPYTVKDLENILLKGDTLNGTLVTLPEEHAKYLNPVIAKNNRVKHIDKKDALIEVHLYRNTGIKNDDSLFSAPLSTFTRADVYELNKSATTGNHILSTVGVVASVSVLVGLIAVAVTPDPAPTTGGDCNCPQVYIERDGQYQFSSGLYSGAVYSTLERKDYLPLTDIPAAADNISFKIANAKDEEQYINEVQLLHVNHPADTRVLQDRYGKILCFQNTAAPLTASMDKDNDVRNLLSKTDDQYYSFSNKANENGFSDVILTFNKPKTAGKAKLVIHARNSKWGGYLHKDFINLFGENFEKWREKQERANPAKLAKWQTDQALPLMVYLKTNKGWKFIDYFPMIGNTASRDMIMGLETEGIQSDKIEIKLETIYRFWDIDFAGIDYSTNRNFETLVMEPSRAVKTDGSDQKKLLLHSDKQYSHLAEDESISFVYKISEAKQKSLSSYFLVSGGYYHSLEPITGKVNYKELYKFRKKGAFDKFSRKKYAVIEEGLARIK